MGSVPLTGLQLSKAGRVYMPRKARLDSRMVRAIARRGTSKFKVDEKLGVRIEKDPLVS